jgi:hypothetical protein
MRKGLLAAAAGLIAQAGLAWGQAPAPLPPLRPQNMPARAVEKSAPSGTQQVSFVSEAPIPVDSDVVPSEWEGDGCECERPSGPRCWGGADYLMWWVRNGPTPPLVTTGNPSVLPAPGALGAAGTRILFGDSDLEYGTFAGGRITVGGWCDCARIWGWEASGFLLERRSDAFRLASSAAGTPPLYVPFFNVGTGKEGSFAVADPGLHTSGSVRVFSATRLWGAEANALRHLMSGQCFDLDLLGGFRYLDLQESLVVSAINVQDNAFDTHKSIYESFSTRNHFYGPQLGARLGYRHGPIVVDLTGKLALGVTNQVIHTTGSVITSGTGVANPGTFPGGIFAQPSNLGRREFDRFGVVPQLQLKVGYDITPRLRATVGYDFLYWHNVVRPGDQIDRSLNLTQFAGGNLAGPARPAPQSQGSGFWAHGVSAGLEYRY